MIIMIYLMPEHSVLCSPDELCWVHKQILKNIASRDVTQEI